jgi:RNA polymerase sigma-70 factor (ECF subfamily)
MSVFEQDLVLLEKLKAGEASAFAAFYEKYRRYLMVVAMSLLEDAMEAQDLVQDFFIDFWERRLYLKIDPSQRKRDDLIKSYIHRIIYNRCMDRINLRKTRQKRVVRLSTEDSVCLPEIRMEVQEWQQQLTYALGQAIAKIPPLSARVFELSYIQHKSRLEVALEMGVSPHTVKNQLVRAIKILRAQLKKA